MNAPITDSTNAVIAKPNASAVPVPAANAPAAAAAVPAVNTIATTIRAVTMIFFQSSDVASPLNTLLTLFTNPPAIIIRDPTIRCRNAPSVSPITKSKSAFSDAIICFNCLTISSYCLTNNCNSLYCATLLGSSVCVCALSISLNLFFNASLNISSNAINLSSLSINSSVFCL